MTTLPDWLVERAALDEVGPASRELRMGRRERAAEGLGLGERQGTAAGAEAQKRRRHGLFFRRSRTAREEAGRGVIAAGGNRRYGPPPC